MKQRLLPLLISPWFSQICIRRRFWWQTNSNHVALDFGSTIFGTIERNCKSLSTNTMLARHLHDNANYRRWQTITEDGNNRKPNRGKGPKRDRHEFTVMSYNILAQDLLDGHAPLYANHDPQALSWHHRLGRLISEIEAIRPDILCVQELQQNHMDHFRRGLTVDYDMLYKKRTGDEKTDGCAVFYRRDLFELLTHQEVEYFQPNINKLNRENVAIIAKLSLKANPRARLVVSTTHLLYNPRRQDIRLAQIQVLLAELDRLAYSGQMTNGVPQYDPVILCGDFNLQPFTAPYELLMKGFLRYDRLVSRTLQQANGAYGEQTGKVFLPSSLGITDHCQHDNLKDRANAHQNQVPPFNATMLHHSMHARTKGSPNRTKTDTSPTDLKRTFSTGSLSHRFVFNSAYGHSLDEPEELREPTTFQDQWITVDYLFYTPYRSVSECSRTLPNWNLELLAYYTLPTVHRCCWEIQNIPNRLYGSDHFALAGRFSLTVPKTKQ